MMEKDIYSPHSSNSLLIGIFFLTISLPILVHIFKADDVQSVYERRELAKLPSIPGSYRELTAFPDRFSDYINDHFGFRTFFLRCGSKIKYSLGLQVTPKVVIGKDGWMFLGSHPSNVIEQYRGIDRFTEDKLAGWVKGMEERQAWLKKQGIMFYIFVAPNKHSIYSEFLPETVGKPINSVRLDQLADYIDKKSGLTLIDPRRSLLSAKHELRLYRKTDTHWTDPAAFIGYRQLMEQIKPLFVNTEVLTKEEYVIKKVEMPGGDLTDMINLGNSLIEKVPVMVLKRNKKAVEYDQQQWKGLTANERVRYFKTNRERLPSAIIFHDSFIWPMSQFLTESFNRTILAHHGGMKFDPEIIVKEKPDMVIYQLVERSLAVEITNPQELMLAEPN